MTARDPVAAARALLEKFYADYWDPPIDLKVGGKDCLSLYAAGPPCDSGEWVASFRDAAGRDLFLAAPALLSELVAEVERLRGVQNRLAERFPLPLGGTFTFDAVTKEWWYGLGAFRKGPFPSKAAAVLAFAENSVPIDNPWPGHPVIEPDPAEAAQAEERARIEALAREEEAWAKEEGRREAFWRAIERWHSDSSIKMPVHEYLGISAKEYGRIRVFGGVPEGWEPPAGLAGEGE